MSISVVIPTYNRSGELVETLQSLVGVLSPGEWEVIVVDNNSTDDTPAVLGALRDQLPLPLRVLHERTQGRSAALNAGITAARGDLIVMTDDDIRVDPRWLLETAAAAEQHGCAYVGGRVLPHWPSVVRPDWLSMASARQRAVLGLTDYGADPLPLGDHPALGCNVAARREVFAQVGLFDNNIGRKAGTLLGQEVREWGIRVRRAGLRGMYAPRSVVYHVVPADRLTRRYFYRWFYWHGISRAVLYTTLGLDMESPEREELDLPRVPHVAGVPRYLYRTAATALGRAAAARLRGDSTRAFDDELWLCYFAGMLAQRWRDRGEWSRSAGPLAAPEASHAR